jgi:hypothetical protein
MSLRNEGSQLRGNQMHLSWPIFFKSLDLCRTILSLCSANEVRVLPLYSMGLYILWKLIKEDERVY